MLLSAELRLSIGKLNALRTEIGEEGPERWQTIVFMADAAELCRGEPEQRPCLD